MSSRGEFPVVQRAATPSDGWRSIGPTTAGALGDDTPKKRGRLLVMHQGGSSFVLHYIAPKTDVHGIYPPHSPPAVPGFITVLEW